MRIKPDDNLIVCATKPLLTPSWYTGALGQTALNLGKAPKDSFDHGRNKPIVFLIHGLMCRAKILQTMGDTLRKHFNVAYAPDFPYWNCGNIDESTQQMRAKMKRVQQNESVGAPIVVGHSLGALIGIKALEKNESPEVVAISTPFRGTPQAKFVPGSACRQLSNRDYLAELHRHDLGDDTTITAYRTMQDSLVPYECQVPYPNSALSERLNDAPVDWPWQHFAPVVWRRKQVAEQVRDLLLKI